MLYWRLKEKEALLCSGGRFDVPFPAAGWAKGNVLCEFDDVGKKFWENNWSANLLLDVHRKMQEDRDELKKNLSNL